MPILGEHEETNECSSFEVRHLGYQLRRALRARKMSNSAINPPLVVIRALISKPRLEIYGFILCYVNRSLTTQNASLNISLFLIMTSTHFAYLLNYSISACF